MNRVIPPSKPELAWSGAVDGWRIAFLHGRLCVIAPPGLCELAGDRFEPRVELHIDRFSHDVTMAEIGARVAVSFSDEMSQSTILLLDLEWNEIARAQNLAGLGVSVGLHGVTDGSLVVTGRSGIECIDAAGVTRWTLEADGGPFTNDVLLVEEIGELPRAIDAMTGEPLWTVPRSFPDLASVDEYGRREINKAFGSEGIFVLTRTNLVSEQTMMTGLDAASGKTRWEVGAEFWSVRSSCSAGPLAALSLGRAKEKRFGSGVLDIARGEWIRMRTRVAPISPIALDHTHVLWHDDDVLRCETVASGEMRWEIPCERYSAIACHDGLLAVRTRSRVDLFRAAS